MARLDQESGEDRDAGTDREAAGRPGDGVREHIAIESPALSERDSMTRRMTPTVALTAGVSQIQGDDDLYDGSGQGHVAGEVRRQVAPLTARAEASGRLRVIGRCTEAAVVKLQLEELMGMDEWSEAEQRFLKRVANRLSLESSQGAFDHLVLMGPPRALGILKAELPHPCPKKSR